MLAVAQANTSIAFGLQKKCGNLNHLAISSNFVTLFGGQFTQIIGPKLVLGVEEAVKSFIGYADSLCDLPPQSSSVCGGEGDPPILNLEGSLMCFL